MGEYATSMVPVEKNDWVKYRLVSAAPTIAKKVGDFDKDGVPGTTKDYAAYYKKFRRMIGRHVPFFKMAARFDRVARGTDSHLLHNAMSIMATVLSSSKMIALYQQLGKAYRTASGGVRRAKTDEQRALAIVKAIGPDFKPLTAHETRLNRCFNETIPMAAMFARSLGVKGLAAVMGPRDRMYIRYKKDGVFRYMNERGESIAATEVTSRIVKGVQKGVYLEPLSDRQLMGTTVFNRGYTHYSTKIRVAHVDFMRARQLLPKSPLVWKTVGNVYALCSDKTKAACDRVLLTCYKAALRLDPAYAPALNNLATERMGKDNKAALALLKRVLVHYPNYGQAHSNICSIYVGMGKGHAKGLPHCNAAVKNTRGVSRALALVQRANSVRALYPNSNAFISDLIRVIKIEPKFADTVLDICGSYMLRDRLSADDVIQVRGFIDTVLLGDENSLKANYMLAHLHYAQGHMGAALDQFEKTAHLLQDDDIPSVRSVIYAKMAKIHYTHMNDPESARDLSDEALDIAEHTKDFHKTLHAEILFDSGVVHAKLGNYAEALEDLTDAVYMDPGFYAHASLGVIARGIEANAFGRKELNLAYGLLSKAIESDPANEGDYYQVRSVVNHMMHDRKAALDDDARASKGELEFQYPLETQPLILDVVGGFTTHIQTR